MVTTKSVQIVQSTETTRKRGGIPSKTIDLGAAAHYIGDKPSTNTSQVDERKTSYSTSTSLFMFNLNLSGIWTHQ